MIVTAEKEGSSLLSLSRLKILELIIMVSELMWIFTFNQKHFNVSIPIPQNQNYLKNTIK